MRTHGVLTVQTLFVVALILLVPSLVAAGAQKMTAARLPMPTEGEVHVLPGLQYVGRGGVSEITWVRLDQTPEESADKTHAVWTLGGRSTVPKLQKVMLVIYLLNEKGKRIAAVKKTTVFKSADTHREFQLEMRVKPKTWKRARMLFVQVNFMVIK